MGEEIGDDTELHSVAFTLDPGVYVLNVVAEREIEDIPNPKGYTYTLKSAHRAVFLQIRDSHTGAFVFVIILTLAFAGACVAFAFRERLGAFRRSGNVVAGGGNDQMQSMNIV